MTDFNFKPGDKVYYPAMLNKIITLAKTNFATYPVLVILDPQGKTERHCFTLDGKRQDNRNNPSIFPATQEWYDKLVHVYPDLEKPLAIQAQLDENSEGVECLLFNENEDSDVSCTVGVVKGLKRIQGDVLLYDAGEKGLWLNASPVMTLKSIKELQQRIFDDVGDEEVRKAWALMGIGVTPTKIDNKP